MRFMATAIHAKCSKQGLRLLDVDGVVDGQLDGDLQHVLAVQRHPRGAVGLVEVAAGGQRGAAVEDADVVEAEEAALEDVVAVGVLAVDPPGEVLHQLLEGVLQEGAVALAGAVLLQLVEEQGGPGVHGRVDVAEVPLVRRDLAVGVQVEAAQQQVQLALGEGEIDHRQGDGVEGEVPGREPRVLPGVRHRHDLVVDHVVPVAVPHPGVGGERVDAVLGQPALDVEVVVLLAPQHPGQRLPDQPSFVGRGVGGGDAVVELVGLRGAVGS
jgi:hypothetical protein